MRFLDLIAADVDDGSVVTGLLETFDTFDRFEADAFVSFSAHPLTCLTCYYCSFRDSYDYSSMDGCLRN